MTTPEMAYAERTRRQREERGWTLHDLAMRTGVSVQKLNRMELGNCRINLNDATAIDNAFALHEEEAELSLEDDDDPTTERFYGDFLVAVKMTGEGVIIDTFREGEHVDTTALDLEQLSATPLWVVEEVDLDAPTERHAGSCGDLVEFHEEGQPVCKSCGPIRADRVEVS